MDADPRTAPKLNHGYFDSATLRSVTWGEGTGTSTTPFGKLRIPLSDLVGGLSQLLWGDQYRR